MRHWPAHLLGLFVLASLAVALATGFWRENAGWGLIAFLLVTVAVGWFLAVRLPRNAIGWLLMVVAALTAVQVPIGLVGQALLPGTPGLAAWLLWIAHDRADLDTWSWLFSIGLMMTQIPLRFPTGHLPSRRWRWFSNYTIAAILLAAAVQSTYAVEAYPGLANPVHISAWVGPVGAQFFATALLFMAAVIGSISSLVVRYREGSEATQAQIRWMAWAVILSGVALTTDAAAPIEWTLLHEWILAVFCLVPISIAVAVLRYRLFEIDRIISRTVAYTLVTVFAVTVYGLVVTSVTWLLPGAPTVAVAGATLAAAAAFLPALRWVQRRVDRSFDRQRYDAQQIIDAFGERLRTDIDPNTTVSQLQIVVDRSLEPTSVGLWTPERP